MRQRTRTLSLLVLCAVIGLAAATAAQPDDDGDTDAPEPTAPVAPTTDVPAAEEPDDPGLDVDALRREYLELRDQLFRSRARAAAVASAMYSTKIAIHLDYTSPRFYTVTRASIRLDGAGVYDDLDGAIARDKAPRFEGHVAPGRHVVTVRVEAIGADDDRFTTTVESSFTVIAPAGKDVVVRARARDGGDIAYQWQRRERGSYKLHLDVDVETVSRAGARARK
jgi:hypothetical protein